MSHHNPFDEWPFSDRRGPRVPEPPRRFQPAFMRRIGDRVAMLPMTLRYQRLDRPTIVLTFDADEDDALVCTSVQVESSGGAPVSTSDLADLPIDEITEGVREMWTLPTSMDAGDGTVEWDLPAMHEPRRWPDLRSPRGRVNPDMLAHIADVYRSHPDAPTRAVADAFGIAHRTASLYAKRAREAHPDLFADDEGGPRHDEGDDGQSGGAQ